MLVSAIDGAWLSGGVSVCFGAEASFRSLLALVGEEVADFTPDLPDFLTVEDLVEGMLEVCGEMAMLRRDGIWSKKRSAL
jgi:hypothetical protein